MPAIFWRLGYLVVFVLVGCAPAGPGGPSSNLGSADRSPAAGSSKVITASSLTPITAFGAWDTSDAGGTFPLHSIHTSPLITTDLQGKPEGRLLSKLPSLEDGTVVILPDGRMRTTWNVRPNVKWHDGAPLTSEDIAFTFELYRHPDVGVQVSATTDNIEKIEASGPSIAIVTWKTTFYQPFRLGLREFWPLPKHLLGRAFDGDKTIFANLPYWTTEYVNSGPFRLVDYGLGENVVFESFDDYFLGRPKAGRVLIRVVRDANVLLANLQAGAIDIASDGALPVDLALALHEEWRKTGEGSVVFAPGSFRFHVVQFDPRWAQPPELSRDVRVREGLLMGLSRETLAETLMPGVPNTVANSFLPELDPRTSAVGRPFSRYPYDPTAAAQRLAAAGWRRASDGRMLNQAGEQVEIAVRSQTAHSKEAAIIAQYWRDLGIHVSEVNVTSSLARDLEFNATFPAFSGHANGSREGFFARLLSTAHATPQNRYAGANTGHYTNLSLDQLASRVYATPDEQQGTPMLRQLGEILATELPILPSYFTVAHAAVRKGVRALVEDFPGSSNPGNLSRNAHLWDRD